MNRVYLLLGSNMGNREQMLSDAVELLIEQLMPDYLEVEDLSTLRPDIEAFREEDSVLGEFIRLAEADPSLDEDARARILALGLSALGIAGGGLWS